MKKMVLGVLIGAGLVIAVSGAPEWGAVHAQRVAPQPPIRSGAEPGSGGLFALPGPTASDGQLFVVVDPKQRIVGVYHVETATGKIALRSVRNIHWDLQMTGYNTQDPLPQAVRSLLEQR